MIDPGNRAKWVHRNAVKPGPDLARIPVGLAFLFLGIVLFFAAFEGKHAGVFIFPTFDFRADTFVIGETIGLLVMGAGLSLAGIVILLVRD